MSKSQELFELLEPLVTKAGYECKDVTFEKVGNNWVLTVTINNDKGISLDDCQTVSELLSPYLDEKDPIEPAYLLEVSSPGIDTPFKSDQDYQDHLNDIVDINLYRKIDGSKKYQGELIGFTDEKVVIKVDKGEKTFLRKDISKIAPAVIF